MHTPSSYSPSSSPHQYNAFLGSRYDDLSSQGTLQESRFVGFPDMAVQQVDSSELDPSYIEALQNAYGLHENCACCQRLLKSYIQLVEKLKALGHQEEDTLKQQGFNLAAKPLLLDEPWLESLDAKNPYSLASGIDNTLKTVDTNISGSTREHVVGGFGSVLSYAGFAGELPVLLKKSIIYFRMYVALRRYTKELRLPGCFRHFLYARGDRAGLIYQKVSGPARKQAFHTKNELTKAYASCITRHLYWRASALKFMGSTVAIAGLLFIFASYIVSYIDPSIQIAIYGYYLEAAAILFYFIMSIGVAAHGKYIDFRASRTENAMQKAFYEIERKSTEEHPILLESVRPSIFPQASEQELEEVPNQELEATILKTTYETAVLQRLRWDLNFSLGHLLANLLQEQKQSQRAVDDSSEGPHAAVIQDAQGPVYNLLHGIIGLQDHSISNLMDVAKHHPAEGIQHLKNLIYKTKIQRH